jgi:hypothetical protein
MKGKFYRIQFSGRLLTCSIALILVGGFGTRLRPLVCSYSPDASDLHPRAFNTSTMPSITDERVDPHSPKAIGRIWKQAHDSAPD